MVTGQSVGWVTGSWGAKVISTYAAACGGATSSDGSPVRPLLVWGGNAIL